MVDLAVIRGRHPSFCSHSDRFPFWALNTKLRAQAQAQGRVFMRKHIGADRPANEPRLLGARYRFGGSNRYRSGFLLLGRD